MCYIDFDLVFRAFGRKLTPLNGRMKLVELDTLFANKMTVDEKKDVLSECEFSPIKYYITLLIY